MLKQTPSLVPFVALLVLAPLAGCGGDDRDDDQAQRKAKPVAGTFVGKVAKTKAFVSVVASPPAKGHDKRGVTVFVCDGRRLCDWFSGSASGNGFVVASRQGDRKAKGKLSRKAATGTIELADGKTIRYAATPATATAGLYDLTVSSRGRLRGASAAGVGLTGKSTVGHRGTGTLKLADGKRVKFNVTTSSADDLVRLQAGQVRLIVLPDHQLRGAGKSRRTSAGGDSDFFIRTSSG